MSLPTLHKALPARKLPVWGACIIIATLLTATSHAQRKRGKKPTVPALPPPVMDRNASRFILPENQKEYLEKMLTRTSMTTRKSDPFGRSQDPDTAAPETLTGADGQSGRPSKQTVPLQQVVSLLKISTVMPREKRFLIGGDSFQVGETIPLSHRGKSFQAQVVSVNSTQISFRDPASGETATIEMKLLPPGMQPGAAAPGPPGLFRKDKQAPINLDAP